MVAGPMFLFSFGSIQLLCLTDTEIVKEISLCTSLSLGKPPYLVKDRGALVGQGIGSSSGPTWAHQRKIIAPEFYIDNWIPFTNTNMFFFPHILLAIYKYFTTML